jgi:hypothetical protein
MFAWFAVDCFKSGVAAPLCRRMTRFSHSSRLCDLVVNLNGGIFGFLLNVMQVNQVLQKILCKYMLDFISALCHGGRR